MTNFYRWAFWTLCHFRRWLAVPIGYCRTRAGFKPQSLKDVMNARDEYEAAA